MSFEYYIQKDMEQTVDFISSETYKNIMQALAGELMSCTKYSLYAGKAYADGYVQVGDMFAETSENEKEHAEIFMKLLNSGSLKDTLDNLADAYSGENNEWMNMYKDFADTARDEGFKNIADVFEKMCEVEKHHDYRFRSMHNLMKNEEMFDKNENSMWVCLNCGYIHEGEASPEKGCPLCGAERGYFKLNCEDY